MLLRNVKDEAADPDYRLREAETAVLSAFSTGLTGPGPAMMLSWAVSAAARVPKAAAYTVLLPWVLESPLYTGSPKFGELARLIADQDEDASDNPAERSGRCSGFSGCPAGCGNWVRTRPIFCPPQDGPWISWDPTVPIWMR